MKKIILCADDYGQNTCVSQAILQLLDMQRLSATSCLVTHPNWEDAAFKLKPLQSAAEIGLHFNLTEGQPLSTDLKKAHGFMPLIKLLLRANLGQLNQTAIEAELEAQLDRFTQSFNCLPDFIDGHQHIHQFPIIRDALFKVYAKKLAQTNCYLRSTAESYIFCLTNGVARIKRTILQLSGAQIFKQKLIQQKIPHNSSFSGVYDFKQSIRYAEFFPNFLKNITDGGLILCHPGFAKTAENNDPLKFSRINEYNYFVSEQFILDCEKNRVQINCTRFIDTKINPLKI